MKSPSLVAVALFLFPFAASAVSSDQIFVEVAVDEAAPSVTFDWDEQTDGVRVEISRRVIGETGVASWNALGTVDHPDRTFTDSTLQSGVAYEYKIHRPYIADVVQAAASYVAVGIEAPLVEDRGRMLLLVEEEMGARLAPELARLEMDLVGDGWEVIREDFPRDGIAHPDSVRSWIQSKYAEAPAETKGLYLFGRLPIMRGSGNNPDGHNAYEHASDPYFADVDDLWPDNGDPTDTVLGTAYIPDAVELINGRVDLAGMTEWEKSEEELLRDYLNKAHRFKRAGLEFTRRGTPAGSSWIRGEGQLLYSMFGPDNIEPANFSGDGLVDGDDNPLPGNFHWVADFGNWNGSAYANNVHKSLFNVNFGSHKQKWSRTNNPMRALLAQPEWGLTCVWGGRPYWFFHTGNLGYPAGDWAKRTQNNRTGEYAPEGAYTYMRGAAWNNLMGDPSLRMHPVAPPNDLTATRSGGQVALAWTASTDPSVLGYHLYRAESRLGPYTKLNGSTPVTGTVFTDTAPPASGDLWYQVRAVKLETVYTGSYFNQSLGTFAHLPAGESDSDAPPVIDPLPQIQVRQNVPALIEVVASDPEDAPLAILVTDHPDNGTLAGTPPRFIYRPDPGFTGTDSFTVQASDGVNLSDPLTV
ncbi:MAG: Ig-like domain-containing protein, partial [Puniceicoccaceae bacterium]